MSFSLSLRRSTPQGERTDHAVVQVSDDTTVEDLSSALGVKPYDLSPDSAPSDTLAEARIYSGAIIPPRPDAPTKLPPATKRLEVVAGPFAGEVYPIFPGVKVTIGTAEGNQLIIADPYIGSHQATLTVDIDPSITTSDSTQRQTPLTATITPGSDATPMLRNGEMVEGSFGLVPADIVQIGSCLFRIGIEPASNADIIPERNGTLAFNRASRIQPPPVQPVVNLPGEKPEKDDKTPLPWLSALIPVVMGVTMAIIFNRPYMLMMAAAAPLMVVGSYVTSAKRAKRKGIKTIETWKSDVEKTAERLIRLARQQRLNEWYASPDPVVVRDIATGPSNRLWERRALDADALQVRVGVAEADLDVRFEGAGTSDKSEVRRVGVSPTPIVADLAAGVVGIAGPENITTNTVRAMVTQLATLRSPRDLSIVILCDESRTLEWEWAQWLPHTDGGAFAHALIGNSDDTRRERIRELNAQLEHRQRSRADRNSKVFSTHHLLVVDVS